VDGNGLVGICPADQRRGGTDGGNVAFGKATLQKGNLIFVLKQTRTAFGREPFTVQASVTICYCFRNGKEVENLGGDPVEMMSIATGLR